MAKESVVYTSMIREFITTNLNLRTNDVILIHRKPRNIFILHRSEQEVSTIIENLLNYRKIPYVHRNNLLEITDAYICFIPDDKHFAELRTLSHEDISSDLKFYRVSNKLRALTIFLNH